MPKKFSGQAVAVATGLLTRRSRTEAGARSIIARNASLQLDGPQGRGYN